MRPINQTIAFSSIFIVFKDVIKHFQCLSHTYRITVFVCLYRIFHQFSTFIFQLYETR